MPYAARGRPRAKSPEVLKAEGRFIRHANAALREKPRAPGSPVPSKRLDEEELGVFYEIVDAVPPGLLAKADSYVVERLASNLVLVGRCKAQIAKDGLLAKREGTPIRHPLLSVAQAAWVAVQQSAEALGLTPGSRNRLVATPEADSSEALPEDLFGVPDHLLNHPGEGHPEIR